MKRKKQINVLYVYDNGVWTSLKLRGYMGGVHKTKAYCLTSVYTNNPTFDLKTFVLEYEEKTDSELQ